MSVKLLHGDCRDILPTLEADSFDCIVTSPPYWGLRDYGVANQIGLEPTLDAYVETMRDVARELWRVLKPTGCFFLNLGDSYTASSSVRSAAPSAKSGLKRDGRSEASRSGSLAADKRQGMRLPPVVSGLKPKDLCGVPWRVAFALQAEGWYLRSAIVWHKPNPMPESVRDRPTSAYEMVFLLTKGVTYFYDGEAIAEASETGDPRRPYTSEGAKSLDGRAEWKSGQKRKGADFSTRNARNVWTIATQPYKGAHFATMPPDLAERCIKAGCPSRGHVLDPFGGSGTTGLVADRLGRHATLIELNQDYRAMQRDRISSDAPLLAEVAE